MGWWERRIEGRRLRALIAQVAALRGSALPPELEAAVAETARVLPARLLGPARRSLHAPLVMVFARQRADAGMRLASSYWSSNGGRNVGMDVLAAEGRARGVLLKVLKRRPRSRRLLADLVQSLDQVIVAQRRDAADQDGYGLATLHEIRRDLAELALKKI